MARVSGLEKKQAPWHLRWFYGVMRRMFGKDLAPAKAQMQLAAQIAFENYRARWNRLFNVESDNLYYEVAPSSRGQSQHLAGRDRRARRMERTASRNCGIPTIYWMTSNHFRPGPTSL
jgi:hypothetical protein